MQEVRFCIHSYSHSITGRHVQDKMRGEQDINVGGGEGMGGEWGIIVRDNLNEGNIALGTVLADGTRQTPHVMMSSLPLLE